MPCEDCEALIEEGRLGERPSKVYSKSRAPCSGEYVEIHQERWIMYSIYSI